MVTDQPHAADGSDSKSDTVDGVEESAVAESAGVLRALYDKMVAADGLSEEDQIAFQDQFQAAAGRVSALA